jgi:hypothetical protein
MKYALTALHLGQPALSPRAPSPAEQKPMSNKTIDKYRPKNPDEQNLGVQTAGIKR